MRDLRAFLRHHIEAFLDHEFGPVTEHNVTPPGVRRPVWTPDHTERLVAHLAGNWAPVAEPPSDEVVYVDDKGQKWTRADIKVRDALQDAINVMGGGAADNAQADAAAAAFDATPEGERPPVNTEVPW